MQYFKEDMIEELVEGYSCSKDWTETAVDRWIEDIKNREYVSAKILDEGSASEGYDMSFDGDLEIDAEHIYSKSEYWNLPGSDEE